jgi:hypothetical protein
MDSYTAPLAEELEPLAAALEAVQSVPIGERPRR